MDLQDGHKGQRRSLAGAGQREQGRSKPYGKILHCYYKYRVSLCPAIRNVTRHCLSPVCKPISVLSALMFV